MERGRVKFVDNAHEERNSVFLYFPFGITSSYIFQYYSSFLMVCIACNDADAINV